MARSALERLRDARLARQRRAEDVDSLVRDSIGLHSTDYWSPYLSAWARIPGFAPATLLERLNRGQGLARVNSFRNTVHVVLAEDLALIQRATGESVAKAGRGGPGPKGCSDAEIARGLARIEAALEGGPLDNAGIKAQVPELAENLRYWLLVAMGRGNVLRADTAHARSNRARYALTRQWIAGWAPSPLSVEEARRELLIRAVRAFGPVTDEDLSWWLPATKTEVRAALRSMGDEGRKIEEAGRCWWYAADLADAPAPGREAQGAWLLPYEDGLLKGYRDRDWLLAPGLREVLFPYSIAHWHPPDGADPGPGPHKGVNVSGEARPSVWWGGRVVGRWELGEGGPVWQVHAQVGGGAEEAIAGEIGRLGRFTREELGPIS